MARIPAHLLELVQLGDFETVNELLDARINLQIRNTLGELSPALMEELARVLPSSEQILDEVLEEFKALGLLKIN